MIDIPDKRLSDFITYLHQNKGVFPNRRKKQFEENTDAEFEAIGSIYSEIFSKWLLSLYICRNYISTHPVSLAKWNKITM